MMRGKKAWKLLEEHYGKELTNALYAGREIKVFANNLQWYSIKIIFDDFEYYIFKNLTLNFEFCLEMEYSFEYPIADLVFNLLEHIRLDPDGVNLRSNVIRSRHEWEQVGVEIGLALFPYIKVETVNVVGFDQK